MLTKSEIKPPLAICRLGYKAFSGSHWIPAEGESKSLLTPEPPICPASESERAGTQGRPERTLAFPVLSYATRPRL